MTHQPDPFRQGLSFATRIGVELVVTTLVGTFLGYLLDRWLGTEPWLMILGVLFGSAAGFRNVYRVANITQEKPDAGDKEKKVEKEKG